MSEVDMTVEELFNILYIYGYRKGCTTLTNNNGSILIVYTDKPSLFNLFMPEGKVSVYSPRRVLTDEEWLYLKLNESHLELITLEDLIRLAKNLQEE